MGVLSFILTILFVPGFPAAATAPRWALLSLAVPLIMLWKTPAVPNVLFWPTFFIVVAALLSPDPYGATAYLWRFFLLASLFCIGRELSDLSPVFIGAALGFWLNSAIVLGQMFFALDVTHVTDNSGLFVNRNTAVEAAAMVAAWLVFKRLWWLLPGLLPTLVAGARAPILALGVAGATALWAWSRFWALIVLLLSALAIALLWLHNGTAPSGAPYAGCGTCGSTAIIERLNLWRDVLPHLSLLGYGPGSFEHVFPLFQAHTDALSIRFDHAHNEFLQVAFELGLGGLVLYGLFIWRFARLEPTAEWYAGIVFLVEACFEFPLYMPVTGFLFALCAGHLLRPGHRLRARLFGFRMAVPGGPLAARHRAF